MRKQIGALALFFISAFVLVLPDGELLADSVVLSATDYPPYEFAEPEGGVRGFDVEVIEAAFDRVNISTEFKFLPWKRALEQTKVGIYTGIFSCSYLPDREEFFLYSDQISRQTTGLFVRRDFDGFEPRSFEEVKGLKVGGVLGWGMLKVVEKAGAKVITDRSEKKVFNHLLKRTYDYAVLNLEPSGYQALKMGISKDVRFLKIKEKNLHLCISKKWPNAKEVVRNFNKGLAAIRSDGTYDRIHKAYR